MFLPYAARKEGGKMAGAVLGDRHWGFSGSRSSGLRASTRGPHVPASGTGRARGQPTANCRDEW